MKNKKFKLLKSVVGRCPECGTVITDNVEKSVITYYCRNCGWGTN